jgi:hypothetical protein
MARRRKLKARRKRVVRRPRASVSRTRHPAIVGRQEVVNAKRSLRKLVTTLELLSSTSDSALQDTARLRSLFEREYEFQIVTGGLKDNVFRDLVLLDKALDSDVANVDELRRLRMVPAAVLRWLSMFLHVDPHMEVGAEREVSSDAVSKFEWVGAEAGDPGTLMKIRVVAPGWNWRGTLLAKPTVERVGS